MKIASSAATQSSIETCLVAPKLIFLKTKQELKQQQKSHGSLHVLYTSHWDPVQLFRYKHLAADKGDEEPGGQG